MFDIGWSEFFVVAVLVLLVLGPKELPKVFYEIGKWVRYIRAVTSEFRVHVDQMVRDVELEDLKKDVDRLRSLDMRSELENKLDPEGIFRQPLHTVESFDTATEKEKGRDTIQSFDTATEKERGRDVIQSFDTATEKERGRDAIQSFDTGTEKERGRDAIQSFDVEKEQRQDSRVESG